MIIDFPYVIELARGVEKRILEANDSQLLIPATLLPIVGLMLPTVVGLAANVVANQSAAGSLISTRTNQAALTTTILTLPQGLYELQVNLAVRTNYTLIGAALPDVRLLTFDIPLINSMALLNVYATVGANVNVAQSFNVLMTAGFIIQLAQAATGIGQTQDVAVSVNAIRKL